MIEDCLMKDPQDRPPHATAVALRLGLGDSETMGLGLGLDWSADSAPPDRLIAEQPSTITLVADLP